MIVVTGGAGFIGSCLIRKLNSEGISDILIVDELRKGVKWKNLIGKSFRDFLHKDDFRQRLGKGDFGSDFDTVFHFGACSRTTEEDADYLLDNNYSYSRELAQFAAGRDIRFIYASSAATYGDGSRGYSDGEFDSLVPLNMYGFSKHLFDQWVLREGLDTQFTGIKFFNVFGPNEYHKADMASLVYKAYHQVIETGSIRLFKSYRDEYADGEQMRDFIYVGDVVEVIWSMWRDAAFAGIYNLGTGKARTWNALASSVFRALDRPVNIEYIDMPDSLRNQYQYFTQADTAKLETSGASRQFRELEDTVAEYVRDYLHPTVRNM